MSSNFLSRLSAVPPPPAPAPAMNYYSPIPSQPLVARKAPILSNFGNFIYFVLADIVVLLIGVILIIVSQSKCKDSASSKACKNYKIAGAVITTISSVVMLLLIWLKFRKVG